MNLNHNHTIMGFWCNRVKSNAKIESKSSQNPVGTRRREVHVGYGMDIMEIIIYDMRYNLNAEYILFVTYLYLDAMQIAALQLVFKHSS